MSNKTYGRAKRVASIVVAISLITVGNISFSTVAKATDSVDVVEGNAGVKYVQYSADFEYDTYFDNDKAPAYSAVDSNGVGYLFGGWYDKVDNNYTPISDKRALEDKKGVVVAKFVPAQTMSVKCQNWAGTKEGTDGVIVRVISAVDSKNYQNYGFEISKIVNGTESSLGTYTSKDSNDVYSRFNYYESTTDDTPDVYEPAYLFGSAAKYFTSCTVGRIPAANHDAIICIKPFWNTLDGAKVYGLSKFAHVEDGYLGYVNVPVNLNILSDNNGAAAGYLSVECKSEGLTFLGLEEGVENGKVFDEMEVNVTSDGIIKCVGNTENAKDKYTNDIYINLKFQRNNFDASNLKPDTAFIVFVVENEDFANNSENSATADVWNVIY